MINIPSEINDPTIQIKIPSYSASFTVIFNRNRFSVGRRQSLARKVEVAIVGAEWHTRAGVGWFNSWAAKQLSFFPTSLVRESGRRPDER